MTPSPAEQREVLKLGPPASGDVVITVDAAATGASFSAGTQALQPGAQIPPQQHLQYDQALFIHKGQGRATLHERVINLVPGSALHVPRGAWYSVRNTGTGLLQWAWVASPGLESFVRDVSRLGAAPAPEALQELAQRHQIGFRPAGDMPAGAPPAGERRRHRRGGRRRSGRGAAAQAASVSSEAAAPAASVSAEIPEVPAAPATASAEAPRRHRRGRRGRGGGRPPRQVFLAGRGNRANPSAPVQPGRSPAAGAAPSDARSSAPAPSAPARARSSRPRSDRPRGRRRGKEVYMDGRWVWVEEGGTVIAPGRDRSERRSSKGDDDDDAPPPIRLSVSL